MIVQEFYLDNYDWSVVAFIIDDFFYPGIIMNELINAGCDNYISLMQSFIEAGDNAGFTFSSPGERKSVLVIGKSTDAEEFQSTLDHEKGHLATHIAISNKVALDGEDYQYLVGEIGRILFKVCKRFLCDHCRITHKS